MFFHTILRSYALYCNNVAQRFFLYLSFCLLALLKVGNARAQANPSDTIRLGGIVVGTDTFAMIYLPDVIIYGELPRHLARARRREERRQARYDAKYARLRYNVYKVYPYAVTAAYLLKDVNKRLEQMPDRRERKEYLKKIEKELNKRFKGELEQFTIQQGVVLVKLINRQTGQSCYDIIKEVKGGFNAVVWQGVALVFGNNLRREYDPEDRDKDIEAIVQEIERTQTRQ